jgi:hypothetical protein
METADSHKRRIANPRAKIIRAWDDSEMSAAEFLYEYNAGKTAADIRAEFGGKTICRATLYNRLAKYQTHDAAGLLPKYKDRGGHGASLDKRTKELIWFYYLHKNKPSAAQVIRSLEEKEKITTIEPVVYRYIQHEIPQSVNTLVILRQSRGLKKFDFCGSIKSFQIYAVLDAVTRGKKMSQI